jgi:CheY-like chemotaxis protein
MPKLFLLIDDDPDDAELFSEALSTITPSITFHHSEDGQMAFEFLSAPGSQRPDLIFLDLNMPGMNGWQCLKKLKDDLWLKDIPVLMYSTSSYQKDKEMAKDMGAVGFITKPSEYRMLQKILGQIAHNDEKDLRAIAAGLS